jgi:hypothetical protein
MADTTTTMIKNPTIATRGEMPGSRLKYCLNIGFTLSPTVGWTGLFILQQWCLNIALGSDAFLGGRRLPSRIKTF